jgi:hypothetical protein
MKFLVSSLLFLSLATLGQAQAPAPAASTAAAPAPATAGIRAVKVTVILKTSLSSHDAAAKQFTAVVEKDVQLPDSLMLPKGTVLHGRLLTVSPHGKGKPNGAMMLFLDEARPKGHAAIPLLVKIQSFSPSGSDNDRESLPGARLGGTSNSGGVQQNNFDQNDHTEIRFNMAYSGLKDVYLEAKSGASGVVYANGSDVYLDDGIQMHLLVAPVPPAPAKP